MSTAYRRSRSSEGPDECCRAIAQSQFGVITRQQALEAGLTEQQFSRRIAGGILARIHPAVYRLVGVPATWEGRPFAAQEWAGSNAVVSHRAAARLYALDGIVGEFIELTIPSSGYRGRPGVTLHRSSDLDRGDWRWKHPFRITKPERTICDLAAVLRADALESALESVLRLRLTTLSRIADAARRRSRKGLTGSSKLKELLRARDPLLAPTESDLETAWQRIARKGGLPPHTSQFRVMDGHRYLGRMDFVWSAERVAIEVDGWRWHSGRKAWVRDGDKSNFLQQRGWVVLRFTWEQIRHRPEEVIAQVRAVLYPRLLSSA